MVFGILDRVVVTIEHKEVSFGSYYGPGIAFLSIGLFVAAIVTELVSERFLAK